MKQNLMKKLLLVSVIALSAQSSFAWSGTFYNVIENSSDLTFETIKSNNYSPWDNWGWNGWDDIHSTTSLFFPNTIIYQADGSTSYTNNENTLALYFKNSSNTKFQITNIVNMSSAKLTITCNAYTPTQNDKALWWFGYKNGNEGEHFPDMQVNISVKNSTDTVGYYDLYYSFSRPTNKGTVNVFDSNNAISVSGNSLPYTGILRKCFTK